MKKLLIVLIALVSTSTIFAQEKLTSQQIDEISKAVVEISGVDGQDVYALGSGTIISADGRIYTNRHVVEGFDTFIIAVLDDPNELPVQRYLATVIHTYNEDFAELQIVKTVDGKPLPSNFRVDYLTPTVADVNRGDDIFIFGYPELGDGYIVLTQGTITTIQNGDVGDQRIPVLFQTDAEISPGNSGGLVVNANGEIVGLPTFVNSEDRTNGKLGGVLPFGYLQVLVETGVSANTGSGFGNKEAFLQKFSSNNEIDCSDDPDTVVTNGATFFMLFYPNIDYTITVLGVGDFDPVLAIANEKTVQDVTCSDDASGASQVSVDLPSVRVDGDNSGSQLKYRLSGQDATLGVVIVAEKHQRVGDFVLVIEGLDFTGTLGDDDLVLIIPNSGMKNSSTPLTAYMIGVDEAFDPLLYLLDPDTSGVLHDRNDDIIACEDAGGRSGCWGGSVRMDNRVIRNGNNETIADDYDAMLKISQDVLASVGTTLVMSSQETQGTYVMALHVKMR